MGKLDIWIVLTYPLTPVPLVFCHLDGTINRTNQAVLYKNLEKRITSDTPEAIDANVIDVILSLQQASCQAKMKKQIDTKVFHSRNKWVPYISENFFHLLCFRLLPT